MTKATFLVSALTALLLSMPCDAAKKVHTIGDSTMADQPETGAKRGWGQMFQQFFTNGLEVNNRGKSGSSSKSFYLESAYWQSVKKQIQEGDYVIIQFGHNDEKNGGADGDTVKAYYNHIGDAAKAASVDYRGTTASGTFKMYLRKYVEETRALGATPIIASPICRRYFSGNTIRRNGQHDLGDSFTLCDGKTYSEGNGVPESDNTHDYAYHSRMVAEEMNVPFIDLTTLTKDLYLQYGDAKSAEILFTPDDGTHPSAIGSTLVARLCAQQLQKLGILTEYINLTSDLSINPSTVDLGKAYKGQVVTKEFQVNGFDLQPTDGTVTVTGSDNLLLSLDGTTFSKSISVNYEGGNMTTTFTARYEFVENGKIEETMTIVCGDKTINVPVTGECVVLSGGVETMVYWRLEKDNEATITGPVTSLGQSFSEMYIQRYSNPNKATTWPEWTGFDAGRKTQRCLIEGDAWPAGEIDEVSTRYIEFAVTPAKGTQLNVDSISLFLCGCGGNGMRSKVYYSKEENFANPVNVIEYTSMKANDMMYLAWRPVMTLAEGETLRVRVYPWYNGAATGKTICLSDVTIHGFAEDSSTGITSITNSEVSVVTYYGIDGRQTNEAAKGLNIVRTKYIDGTVKTVKIMK